MKCKIACSVIDAKMKLESSKFNLIVIKSKKY